MGHESDNVRFAREVIEAEICAVQGLLPLLREGFDAAVECLLACKGRVVVTGMGKAGIVGQKLSATLASTGTPSHFLHPVDAVHGDIGRIVAGDVVLALSNSGETEVVELLPSIKRIEARIVAVTGNSASMLARQSDIVLNIGKIAEACPLGLAPSASTTAMLALGDALALAVARRRDFTKEQYAEFHPGGELGRKLMKVDDVMRGLDQCVAVRGDLPMKGVIERITHVPGRAGAACVVDGDDVLVGIFTDGDLRRRVLDGTLDLDRPVSDLMIRDPKRIALGSLAEEAAGVLSRFGIDELPVVDADGRLAGIVDVQDLLEVRVR